MPRAPLISRNCTGLAFICALIQISLVTLPEAAAGPLPKKPPSARIASQLIPVAVFGRDDRSPLPPAHSGLDDRIGTLVVRGASVCTAFCVAPGAIATASHCLFGTEESRSPDIENMTFSVGSGNAARSSRFSGGRRTTIRNAILSGTKRLRITPPIDAANDWAVVPLARPICQAGSLPMSQATRVEIEAAAHDGLVYQVAMHRDVSANTLAFGRPCTIAGRFPGVGPGIIRRDFAEPPLVFLHTCDTGAGSSGSPLLFDGPRGPEVVALNVGTYILSKMSEKNAGADTREISEPIANTAIAIDRIRAAVDALALATSALPDTVRRIVPRRPQPRRAGPY